MKTFQDFADISDTINSIKGLSDAEKVNLCNLMFDKFKENLSLENENNDLKAKLFKARREMWR